MVPPTGLAANYDAESLAAWVTDARDWTFALVEDLGDDQILGDHLDIVNPLLWEIGHVAWFQERWVLRRGSGRKPINAEVDSLYDSMAIPHDTRWDLPVFSRPRVIEYLGEVRRQVLDVLAGGPLTDELAYFVLLSVFHEDMHTEAFVYTRQTHGYARPPHLPGRERTDGTTEAGPLAGDVDVPGGTVQLGASRDTRFFIFDNEKWAHDVEVAPFAIARAATTQAEFAAFVDDGGYERPDFWSDAGRGWLAETGARHPVHWRRSDDGEWQRRDFDLWVPLEPHRAVVHVCWYEADAYCRWAGRRLPREVEWDVAAACSANGGGLSAEKRRYPWGERPPAGGIGETMPASALASDGRVLGCSDVASHPEGESAFGCRQMLGNVWEWTADPFEPFPGFSVDAYADYSKPWFSDHNTLRGGSWITRARWVNNGTRNFYKPDRRDPWVGFRTCAI